MQSSAQHCSTSGSAPSNGNCSRCFPTGRLAQSQQQPALPRCYWAHLHPGTTQVDIAAPADCPYCHTVRENTACCSGSCQTCLLTRCLSASRWLAAQTPAAACWWLRSACSPGSPDQQQQQQHRHTQISTVKQKRSCSKHGWPFLLGRFG